MKHKTLLIAGSLMLCSAHAWSMDYGTMLANTCTGCHGPNGISEGPAAPTIGGLNEDTFTDAMLAFKEGERPSTIMERIAKPYTEEEIKLMAAYFAKQKFVGAEQTVDTAKVEKGGKYHKEYCDKCHEDNGTKDIDGSSILGGQWLTYLQYSMADFHGGARDMSKKMGKRMKKMVEEHGEESLDEVSHFYAGQKP